MSLPDWRLAHGLPRCDARIRVAPSDFLVNEFLGVDFSGDGEHDVLQIKKTGANTEWVARQLASFADVKPGDVGYSGLKDRHAITTQWFSVPRWHSPNWQGLDAEGVELLSVSRHSRKIRRGTHKSNRFVIRLRLTQPPAETLHDDLCQLRNFGVPNYFGEQRFGRNGNNVILAEKWASGARLPRHKRGLAISTARSFLFNNYLSTRVEHGTWNKMLPGDTANLDGTASVFAVTSVDDEILQRCESFDIHPAGPMFGEGSEDTQDLASSVENWKDALRKARVQGAHRSLRLLPRDMKWTISATDLELSFALGRGAYATAVLREIANTAVDTS